MAAAKALALPERAAAFVLVYDERNPYFREEGDCAWPVMLKATLAQADREDAVRFRARSWQELVALLERPEAGRDWLREKHSIG